LGLNLSVIPKKTQRNEDSQLLIYYRGSHSNTSLAKLSSTALLARAEVVQRELEACKRQQDFTTRQIDTCLNRLGVCAGVVGAAFQVAAFGVAVTACNFM
jgi:hypothetical protein